MVMLRIPVRLSFGKCLGLCLLGVGVVLARAAEKKPVMLPNFAYPEPIPALVVAAEKEGALINKHEWPAKGRRVSTGDSVTFLVSLREGSKLRQWVLTAEMAELTAQEAQLPPLKGYHAYSSTGTELKFDGRRAAVNMTLIGPVDQSQAAKGTVAPEVKRRRLLVNEEYLALGFSAASEAVLALRVENAKRAPAERFASKSARKPFPADVTAANRKLADEVGFTLERERGFYGSVPALLEFFNLIMKTPGLQDIVKEVVDVSWWSVLTNAGNTKMRWEYLSAHIRKVDNFAQTLPQHAFPIALKVNDKPAMVCVLVVIPPVAPFGTTAGVIGVHAGRPYDPEPQLTVRLVGSRSPDAVSREPGVRPVEESRE